MNATRPLTSRSTVTETQTKCRGGAPGPPACRQLRAGPRGTEQRAAGCMRSRGAGQRALLGRDDGGGQLLVVPGEDALAGLQQGHPAAGLQGLGALIDDHHVEEVVRQQPQGAVGRRACGSRNQSSQVAPAGPGPPRSQRASCPTPGLACRLDVCQTCDLGKDIKKSAVPAHLCLRGTRRVPSRGPLCGFNPHHPMWLRPKSLEGCLIPERWSCLTL